MKKALSIIVLSVLIFTLFTVNSFANSTYTVKAGDSLWKIAVKHSVGLSEIKAANPSIKNYSLIYPGQVINLPTIPSSVLAF